MLRGLFVVAVFGFPFVWAWAETGSFACAVLAIGLFVGALWVAAAMQRDARRRKAMDEVAAEDD